MEVSIDATRDAQIEQSSARVGPGGGPKTEEGKEVARWNAARHGIRSPAPVVPGVEKKEDWEDHRGGVLESLSPEEHLEMVLAERVALLSWRLPASPATRSRASRYSRRGLRTTSQTGGVLAVACWERLILRTCEKTSRPPARTIGCSSASPSS